MHKITGEKRSANDPKEGRLLARVLAEDLRRVQGGKLAPRFASVVTGEIHRDWSDAGDDGVWSS